MKNLQEQTDKIAKIFLETLKNELPGHKIMITFSVFKDDNSETWGGWEHTEGMTKKDACWLQGWSIANMLFEDDE
jgi:hypothetical protein